jgi:tRNA modification GTPase
MATMGEFAASTWAVPPVRDTIVAWASAQGAGAGPSVAILRISGPETRTLLARALAAQSPASPAAARPTAAPPTASSPRAWFALLAGPDPARPDPVAPARQAALANSCALPVQVVEWRGPSSYTGEDSCEILVPGARAVVRWALDALEHHARRSEPAIALRPAVGGEFSARAYLAGKLTIEHAEGVAATIAATTRAELDQAHDLLSGATGARARALADRLVEALALVEAGIDFTDQEDVVPIAPGALARTLHDLAREIDAHAGPGSARDTASGRPLVALVGAPNAGKSTLFNALLGTPRSVASPLAGTTRDAIIEPWTIHANGSAATVDLADLAGLDEPHRPAAPGHIAAPGQRSAPGLTPALSADAAAQGRAREVARRADVVVWCDPRGRFDAAYLEHLLPGLLAHADTRIIRVRTRADQPISPAAALTPPAPTPPAPTPPALAVCAIDRSGLDALAHRVAQLARDAGFDMALGVRQRHASALALARAAVDRATLAIDPSARALDAPEVVASHLRAAIDALGQVTGRVDADEVIGRVFARFCVGK